MNNDNLQTPCNSCGRPMQYCSCSGGCNKCGDIKFSEYGCKHNACIRNKQPECPYTAVIPSVTVEDISNIKDLADCFVHVSKINTTFYIDDKHRITSVWQGPVEVSNYDIEENPLNLRSQFLFDYETGYVVYFNAQGKPMNLNDIDAIVERLEPGLQEKINNKLDQMAESGELAEIINQYLKLPNSNIDFKNISSLRLSSDDLYQGNSHEYLQGFCEVAGKIVAAFRDTDYNDNYVRLAEINKSNGAIVRETYLELSHANAITYRSDNGKLYVAACNKAVDGSIEEDNRIFVVDYETFALEQTITVSNLPEGKRIRSVYYDNETNTLYAADTFDVFKLDSDYSIVETIELSKNGIDETYINQTIKKYGNYFVGLFVSFLVVWNLNGDVVKIINIDLIQGFEYIGEPEDIVIKNDGNIILGTCHSLSARSNYFYTYFYESNLGKNISNFFELYRSDTTAIYVYVDANSQETEENGTQEKPFKTIQRAIGFAKHLPKFARINISAGDYENTYITGYKVSLYFSGECTVNGIETNQADVFISSTNNSSLLIKGLIAHESDISLGYDGSGTITVNKYVKSGVYGDGICVLSNGSNIKIRNTTITGNNDNNLCEISNHSNVSLYNCTFNTYAGHYAIHVASNSMLELYESTFGETISDTQHNIFTETGARVFHRAGLLDKNNFVIQSQAMVYPSALYVTLPSTVYYGDVCDIDTHFTHVAIEVKRGGGNALTTTFVIEREKLENSVIETTWGSATGIRFNTATIKVSNNKIRLTDSRSTYLSNSGTLTYETNTSTTPATTANWIGINKVTFLAL